MKYREAAFQSYFVRHPNLYFGHWLKVMPECDLLQDLEDGTICGCPDPNSEGWEINGPGHSMSDAIMKLRQAEWEKRIMENQRQQREYERERFRAQLWFFAAVALAACVLWWSTLK